MGPSRYFTATWLPCSHPVAGVIGEGCGSQNGPEQFAVAEVSFTGGL
jgi:hypothetical protein